MQSAVLPSHVVCLSVCPSVTLVNCDHIGWNSSKIIGRVRDPGGLESEGLTLRSGSILRGRTPHPSQTSDSQALTEFDMVTVQGQAGLSPSESETVTSYTVDAAAADLSHVFISCIKSQNCTYEVLELQRRIAVS